MLQRQVMRLEKSKLGSTGFTATVLGIGDLADRSVPSALKEVSFPPERPQTFQLVDAEGRIHRVPFHRVREVYKNSQRIWHRPDPGVSGAERPV